jgi:hypothetical protein
MITDHGNEHFAADVRAVRAVEHSCLMGTASARPTRDEIDAWFTAVLDGTRTRDEADRWAARWHGGAADGGVEDEVVWWALDLLHGIDMPSTADGDFLHDDQQVRQWRNEFRHRCGAGPARQSAT